MAVNSICSETSPAEEPAAQTLIRQLCLTISEYLNPKQVYDVIQAAHYAVNAHSGQMRKSGEAYICHPLSVAIILAGMRMDTKGIMAGLLHDVLEDTGTPKLRLIDDFGNEIAEMVDGVSKLSRLGNKSRAEAQAENMRKMFLAMGRDLRVIIVKLADRLHNMRTIDAMSQESRKRIARETLEIYAPIANRLGMNQIRLELEDLGFKALYPVRYRVIKQSVTDARGRRKEVMNPMEERIRTRFEESGVQCQIAGREKHLYSIYKKMLNKKLTFSEVFDVYAFRIITQEVDNCYRSLGIVHGLYKPVPEKVKDYIAVPKANGYQSLHTVVIGSFGLPVEFQIRTQEMHTLSETGIAAHWAYKAKGESNQNLNEKTFAHKWLRDILDIHDNTAGDSMEFIDHLKVDLFADEIYVFTPQGGIIKLPRGATVVDFAYAVHTDLGNSSVSARINRHLAPLHSQLENGQTIEVITTEWAKPNPVWLNYVVTAKARAGIRAYLRHFKQKEAISLGQTLLERELSQQGSSLAEISENNLSDCLQAIGLDSLETLLTEIGLGNRMPLLIARRLFQMEPQAGINLDNPFEPNQPVTSVPLLIKGSDGMVVNMAKCCRPIPGDCIVGFFHPGKGIVVHRCECHTAISVRKKQGNWLDVEWQSGLNDQEFTSELQLELLNQRGALAKLACVIAGAGSNIENISVRNEDGVISSDVVLLTVKNRVHLAQVMRKIKQLSVVTKLFRVKA